ncbi:hypothetical protein BUALT_Bualt16G0072300 [Buddleja alternifolia]|uniref:Telomere-associated protein Rif1 N-terminal domain-containing protein n=1 Tax=Buddleja alternifolia TaxID=168488 RepID=A0AAV6W9X2_9LAMI|nr:hypothetical protein BUALT_Bualt16G0072300 [Buddleja alternifolia]
MADFRESIEEIKALLSSQNKALAYPKLLRLQEISSVDSSAVQTLADSSHPVLSSVVTDISDDDEEIAAQALKCLGFMIYHPTVVASIADADAGQIIESLVKVISTTKIKSVCNLGVWCISTQQFNSSLLDQQFQSLLMAITHALDNPIGSLSTTFEAMQAVVKLASSLTGQMRHMSSVWTPPIYRRLVSVDKRDRDMSERCLLKIMPLICPPPVTLSKALAVDMKKKLFLAMKELLDQGMKIQSLQAWRWFIRLLGPYALKNKHLVNEMLKIPERTFLDFDSQVQIASLVAWEGLIDALIDPGVQTSDINCALGHDVQVLRTSGCNNTENEADRCSKRIKLIMAPLIGIMSSKCDVSVHSSCLSTWSYLLHKLGASVSCQSVMKTVWEPIIKVVFRVGPDNKNIWLWNICFDLLDTLILGRNQETIGNLDDQETNQLSGKNITGCVSGKCPVRHYPLNCSPWNLCQLDFFIKMISILVNREWNATVTPEFGRVASEAAVRLFGSLLETVQGALRCVSITYAEVILCLNTIFRFLAKMCEDATSEDRSKCYCPHTCLKFLKVVIERLEPSILGSPLYKMDLELKCIRKFECATEIRCALPRICFMDFEDKVLPVVYLSTLYFSVVVNLSSGAPEYESLLQQMQGYVQLLLSSYHLHEVLHAFICLLYKNTTSNCLQIWVILVNCLRECIDGKKDQEILKIVTDNIGYSVVLHLLSYPFASLYFSEINREVQIITESWNLLYVSVDQASQSVHCPIKSISEDLCAMVNDCIDQIRLPVYAGTELQLKEKNCGGGFVQLCGNIVACVLKQLSWSINTEGSHYIDCDGRKSNIKNSMVLTARFMKLFGMNKERTEPSLLSVASRFLSELVNFVGCLHQKEDVILLIETTSSPLLEWLSETHLLNENTDYQLQVLWTAILKGLQLLKPSTEFDSSFLKFQGPLLERTLDHQNPAISEATINFWNSTYATQNNLEFPKNLLPILDKLSRNGKINIYSRNNCREDSLHRYKVTATLKKCSKRVEISSNSINGSGDLDDIYLGAKRKRVELTEHQKEVRRAQQGRTRDCSGHGPGIQTYTNVDFSQGNEESQDSPDIRDSESILEILRKN